MSFAAERTGFGGEGSLYCAVLTFPNATLGK
jgi:hypothetical protein